MNLLFLTNGNKIWVGEHELQVLDEHVVHVSNGVDVQAKTAGSYHVQSEAAEQAVKKRKKSGNHGNAGQKRESLISLFGINDPAIFLNAFHVIDEVVGAFVHRLGHLETKPSESTGSWINPVLRVKTYQLQFP